MRKSFGYYLIAWTILFVLFNCFIFIIPSTIDGATIANVAKVAACIKAGTTGNLGPELINLVQYLSREEFATVVYNKYGGAFWVGYVAIIASYLGQLICAAIAFKEENNQKFFYNIPLIKLGYTSVVITTIVGGLCMFIPDLPLWLGILVCVITLLLSLLSIVKSSFAAEYVSDVDKNVMTSVSFIKEITAISKTLFDNAESENKDLLKKLYEEIRYSDPMSNNLVSEEENLIKTKLESLKTVVATNGYVKDLVNETIDLLKTRNSKIKSSK